MDSQNSCKKSWDTSSAKQHYRVDHWGAQNFDINSQGNMAVKLSDTEIDLYELSKNLREKNISFPVLVRFPQLLQQSLDKLSFAFERAIESNAYKGSYTAAYPIKVNQQATVIQHFQNQTRWPVSFEVGSKAELIACLGISEQTQTIICNGYKDITYIRLALMGCMLGHDVVIVIESLNELEYVLQQSADLNVQPNLGMRVRLTSIAKGNWQNTGGDHSKFGLTSNEVLGLVERLQEKNLLSSMKMLHFHMGSQIPSLADIKSGITEGMHFFSQLAQHDVNFEQLNVGGGLAVDYEGSGSNTYFSMDYSIQDYANTVVNAVHACCKKNNLAAPTIFSENGRAMTAHHAVLITNVIEAEHQTSEAEHNSPSQKNITYSSADLNMLVEHVRKIEECNTASSSELQKNYNTLKRITKSLGLEFSTGKLSLSEKALADKYSIYAYSKIINSNEILSEEEKIEIENKLFAKYFCNFSLFQSIPDVWGLNQIFPIIPLHRLDKFPSVKSKIYDLTCDSDGQIDRYVEEDSIKPYLSLHKLEKRQDYVLGVFLVGAYQEILGDMHNLFGDTNMVNIVVDSAQSYQICDQEPGDTIAEILSYVHIDTGRMQQIWLERLASNDVSNSNITVVMSEFAATLDANSYLN